MFWNHTKSAKTVICVILGGHTVCTLWQTQAGQFLRNVVKLQAIIQDQLCNER